MVAALSFYLSNDTSQKEDDGNSSDEEEKTVKAKKINNMMKTAGVSYLSSHCYLWKCRCKELF